MKRPLALAALLLTALPLAPADAGDRLLTTWVVERTSPKAAPLTIRGGAGARDGEYAFAAVASASTRADGRLDAAEGALFFGVTPDSQSSARTPARDIQCKDVPVASGVCAGQLAGGGIAFVVWWDEVTFDRAFVVVRGRGKDVDLGQKGSPGWRLRRWTGTTKVVTDADLVSAQTTLGRGAAAFNRAESSGGPGGSVAIGNLPCVNAGYTSAGGGAATLTGGTKDAVATCATAAPAAAAAPGSTEWVFDGAAAGASDQPARLVVIEAPLRQGRR